MSMPQSFDIKVVQDGSHPEGHAVLRVSVVERAPLDDTFVIRRVGEQPTVVESDWPSGPRTPVASEWREGSGELDLLVGPDVVNPILGGTAVSIELPGLGGAEVFLTWPDGLVLAASRNARRGKGRREVAVPVALSDATSRGNDIEQRRVEQQRKLREEADRQRVAQQLQQQQQREAAERARQEKEQEQERQKQRADLERRHAEQELGQRRTAEQEAERQRQELEQRRAAEREAERQRQELEQRRAVEREAERQRQELEQRRAVEREAERQRQELEQKRLAEAERARLEEEARRRRELALARTMAAKPDAAKPDAAPSPPLPPFSGVPAPTPRSGRGPAIILALAVVGALAGIAIWRFSNSSSQRTPEKETPQAEPIVPHPPLVKTCGDPNEDYQKALGLFKESPHEAERLLNCVIKGTSNEHLAGNARSALDDLKDLTGSKKQ